MEECIRKLKKGIPASSAMKGMLTEYTHAVFRVGRCQLFPSDTCDARRVMIREMEEMFIKVFEKTGELLDANLDRYDLHHGHVVLTRCGRLAMILHAKEYPRIEEGFPYELGFCQEGSSVCSIGDVMKERCAIWVYGLQWIVKLDTGEKRRPFGTVYEMEIGQVVGDVYFFRPGSGQKDIAINRGLHVVLFD